MSQNDFVIDNASFPATRADLTSAFRASASNSSGSTAPATTYANMFWYDTSANVLKMRSEANDAWISIGYLSQSTNEFNLFDDTKIVDTSGTQTGLLGDQATSDWQAATSTVESLVSPAKVSAAVAALVPAFPNTLGVVQRWDLDTITNNVAKQNITGRSIQVSITMEVTGISNALGNFYGTGAFQVSSDNVNFITLGTVTTTLNAGSGYLSLQPILPNGYVYRWVGTNGGSSSTLTFATLAILD